MPAKALTARNIQFEALQIFKDHPPQVVFLPSGTGNLLDPSSFLRQQPSPQPP
jgi:hypothetical protein